MNITWRVANALLSLFFGLAAYVQHNDELAVFWTSVYALPCLHCLLVVLDCKLLYCAPFHKAILSLLGLYMIFSVYLFYRAVRIALTTQQYNLFHYAEGKELLGLLIVQSWMVLSVYFLNVRIPFDAMMSHTAKGLIICLALSPFALWLYQGCFGQSQPNAVTGNTNRSLVR